MASGTALTANTSFASCNGSYQLAMQSDGNLVLYMGSRALWATNTSGTAANAVTMQTDGNFVLYAGSSPLWASNTSGHDGATITVQDDGNLVLHAADGTVLWQSHTAQCGVLHSGDSLAAGHGLHSCSGRYNLDMQSDGNLVLYDSGTALWASRTNGTTQRTAIMQTDGNFVVYDASGSPLWASNTSGHAGAHLVVQDDGNVVVYGPGGSALWATGTGGQ